MRRRHGTLVDHGGAHGTYPYVVDDHMIGGFALVTFPARYGVSAG